MTKEEALYWLDTIPTIGEQVDALEMAIKALEQEPCEDCISRQAVLEGIRNLYPDIPIVNIMGARRKWLEKYAPYFECENVVEQLQPIVPQETVTEFADRCKECGAMYGKMLKQKFGEWIPISENNLPEDGTWNLFTDGKSVSVERYKADALDHFCPPGRWFQFDEVVAWMPLPEPYKAESEGKDEQC